MGRHDHRSLRLRHGKDAYAMKPGCGGVARGCNDFEPRRPGRAFLFIVFFIFFFLAEAKFYWSARIVEFLAHSAIKIAFVAPMKQF